MQLPASASQSICWYHLTWLSVGLKLDPANTYYHITARATIMNSKKLLTWSQEKQVLVQCSSSNKCCTSLPSLLLSQDEKKECAAQLHAGMEAGWLRPAVGSQYPLDKAAQAHHDIIESPGAAGKIVLTMWWCDHIAGQRSPSGILAVHNGEPLEGLLQQASKRLTLLH